MAKRPQTPAVDGDFDIVNGSLGYEIKRAQVRCYEALARVLSPLEVTPARLAVLSLVGRNPGIGQAALGEMLNIVAPGVVKLINALEDRGWLARESLRGNRRSNVLFLTDAGVEALHRYEKMVEAYEGEIASELSADEREQLISLLRRVAPREA